MFNVLVRERADWSNDYWQDRKNFRRHDPDQWVSCRIRITPIRYVRLSLLLVTKVIMLKGTNSVETVQQLVSIPFALALLNVPVYSVTLFMLLLTTKCIMTSLEMMRLQGER